MTTSRRKEVEEAREAASDWLRLAPRTRSVRLAHMRSGAEVRFGRSGGAVGSGPDLRDLGWNSLFLAGTPCALRGRELAEPEAPLPRGTEPATQAPAAIVARGLLPLRLRVRPVPAAGNDVAGARARGLRGGEHRVKAAVGAQSQHSASPGSDSLRQRLSS